MRERVSGGGKQETRGSLAYGQFGGCRRTRRSSRPGCRATAAWFWCRPPSPPPGHVAARPLCLHPSAKSLVAERHRIELAKKAPIRSSLAATAGEAGGPPRGTGGTGAAAASAPLPGRHGHQREQQRQRWRLGLAWCESGIRFDQIQASSHYPSLDFSALSNLLSWQ